jgi:hypothetical protein
MCLYLEAACELPGGGVITGAVFKPPLLNFLPSTIYFILKLFRSPPSLLQLSPLVDTLS